MAACDCPVNKILEDEHGNNEKRTRNLTHLPECDSKGRREVESKAKFMRVTFTCWKTESEHKGEEVGLKMGENMEGREGFGF